MHIGILECGPVLPDLAARHGSYGDIFARLLAAPGRSFTSWAVYDMAFPPDVGAADGWVLTGSRYGAYEDHPFIPPLEAFIRAARDTDVPMVGICFGHQIMAQALGGRVERHGGGWGFGHQSYAIDGLGDVALSAIHQDQVTRAPAGAEIIGRSAFCPIAALRFGGWGLSVQAHPEFDPALMGEFLALRARDGDFPPALIAEARAGLTLPHDCARVASWLGAFLARTAAQREGADALPQGMRHG